MPSCRKPPKAFEDCKSKGQKEAKQTTTTAMLTPQPEFSRIPEIIYCRDGDRRASRLGHATYLFSERRSMDEFLRLYTKATREDIRKNREDIAEWLGFVRRVVHGTNTRIWLNKLKLVLGEEITPTEVTES